VEKEELRAFLEGPVLEIAPALLGAIVEHRTEDGPVAVRLTEVEAYDGANDPGSHAYRGRTSRNAVMFGPPGHAYVYFSYGMHWCMNIVCGSEGKAAAVLLRAGAVIEGEDLTWKRRPAVRTYRDLARGPARLTQALGVDGSCDGLDLCDPTSPLVMRLATDPPRTVRNGPRVGLSRAADRPWRFWIDGDPTVSPYRPHTPRNRRAAESSRQ